MATLHGIGDESFWRGKERSKSMMNCAIFLRVLPISGGEKKPTD